MEWYNDHNKLFLTAIGLFLVLTFFVAVQPALKNETINQPLPGDTLLTAQQMRGKKVYIANGCVACHTQQVRNVDMDAVFGSRPSVAADYALISRTDFWRNTATLMGTERTGPDLTDVGNRQGSLEWNLTHLYNPRILVESSVMPSFPFMFEKKTSPSDSDVVVNVPAEFLNGYQGKIVAKQEALDLVAYLQSLKQVPLPDGTPDPEFLYKAEQSAKAAAAEGGGALPDGEVLYQAHCQSCHQATGEGLPGVFPSLKGSPIILSENPAIIVDIIMNGYTGREAEGFGPMPNIGTTAKLSAAEVAAIMNHERTSWGNDASTVTEEEVQNWMDQLEAGELPSADEAAPGGVIKENAGGGEAEDGEKSDEAKVESDSATVEVS